MTRNELKRMLRGPVVTVPTPFDEKYEVDLGRMAAATESWIANGLVAGRAVIKVAAAMGEGPMLGETEWPHLLSTVVKASKGKATVVCGIHYKDTKRTIADAKLAQDLGAVGLQISPPIFNWPTQADILRYYEAVSQAIDIGIIVYKTFWLPSGNILTDTFLKMADFEHVVAIKWSVPDDVPYEEMRSLAPIFNILDNTDQPMLCHRLGGQGYMAVTGEVYPPFDLGIWDLMESGRYEEAQAEYDRVMPPVRAFMARMHDISGGEARVKKAMVQVMGYPMGVSRPPSLPLNDSELAELRDLLASFGWPVPAVVAKA